MAPRRLAVIVLAVIAFVLIMLTLGNPPEPEPLVDGIARTPDGPAVDTPRSPATDGPASEESGPVAQPSQESPDSLESLPGPVAGPAEPEAETTTVRGRILAADGSTLVSPTVNLLVGTEAGFLTRRGGRVKEDGSFEIEGVPVADILDPLKIDAGAKGFLEETYKVSRAAFEEGRIEIVLRPPVTISGRLVDEKGDPVAGSGISYWHGPYVSVSARTDKRGRFSFPSPVNLGLAAYLTHRKHPRGILRWPPTERDLDLGDVVVPDGHPVRGRVVDADGSPRSGLAVVLYSGNRFGREVARLATDAVGGFVFENLGAGPFEVFVLAGQDADGRPLAAREIGLTPGHEPVTLMLHPMVRLKVRFFDAITREPVTLVCPTSRIRRHGDPEDRYSPRQSRAHLKESTFLLDAPGTYDLVLSSGFRTTAHRKDIRLEAGVDRTIDIDMQPRRR